MKLNNLRSSFAARKPNYFKELLCCLQENQLNNKMFVVLVDYQPKIQPKLAIKKSKPFNTK